MMAGRGRGRSLFTFNVDSLGFGRGEALPSSAQAPSPIYPPMQFRPVPLQTGEEVEYMLALKQELRASSRNLPFHIQPSAPRKDVARYSDKYQNGEAKNGEWTPDWNRLPKELCTRVHKSRRSKTKPVVKSTKPAAPKELLQKLENLEKKEEENRSEEEEDEEEEEKKKKKAGEEEEEPADVEQYDEEEFEEETDYIMSYFDNGEDFGGDSDDNMDEATY